MGAHIANSRMPEWQRDLFHTNNGVHVFLHKTMIDIHVRINNNIMEQTIDAIPVLFKSLVSAKPTDRNLTIDTKRILTWKCEGCNGTWKESLPKRALYKWCPECEPAKGRTAIVSKGDQKVTPNPKAKDDCSICCLPASKVAQCPMCDYCACIECTKTFILGGLGEAKCMNVECNKPFSNAFLAKTCTKKWLNGDYKDHMDTVWFDRDRALIPDTMPLIALKSELRSAKGKLTNRINKYRFRVMELQRYNLSMNKPMDTNFNTDEQLNNLTQENAMFQTIINDLNVRIEVYPFLPETVPFPKHSIPEVWIQGCEREGCNGLVNSKMVCGACNGKICKECRVALNRGEKHVCDANDVATVKSMSMNTKPCPKCAVPIYKIDGCDQMWCVECKTAFSWVSGRVETTTIHNPHYYEWLRSENRKNGGNGEIARNAGVQGNCELWPNDVQIIVRINLPAKSVMECDRIVASVQRGHIFNYNDTRAENSLYILRAKYIKGTINETHWRTEMLQKRRWSVLCKRSNEIYATYCLVMRENIETFVHRIKELPEKVQNAFDSFYSRAIDIREYFNHVLVEENTGYDYDKINVLNANWDICSYRKLRSNENKSNDDYDE